MTQKEFLMLKAYAAEYMSKVSGYFDSSFPGLTINDPILTLVRMMASKNPSSLIKALLFSDNVGKLDM